MPLYQRPLNLSDEDILALPIDRLGFEILRQFDGGTQVHIYNYLNSWRNVGVSENSGVMRALAEACEWLRFSGLVAEPSGIGNGFITRLGQKVLDCGLPFLR